MQDFVEDFVKPHALAWSLYRKHSARIEKYYPRGAPKLRQSRIHRFRVPSIRLNQNIEVFRDTGLCMERHGVAPPQ